MFGKLKTRAKTVISSAAEFGAKVCNAVAEVFRPSPAKQAFVLRAPQRGKLMYG